MVRRLVASLVVVPTCVQAHGYIGCILHGTRSDDVRVVLDGRLHDGADVMAVNLVRRVVTSLGIVQRSPRDVGRGFVTVNERHCVVDA